MKTFKDFVNENIERPGDKYVLMRDGMFNPLYVIEIYNDSPSKGADRFKTLNASEVEKFAKYINPTSPAFKVNPKFFDPKNLIFTTRMTETLAEAMTMSKETAARVCKVLNHNEDRTGDFVPLNMTAMRGKIQGAKFGI